MESIKADLRKSVTTLCWSCSQRFRSNQMERWKNKIAVVTGASAGIGKSCCQALLRNGMIVVGLARRQELMESEFKPSLSEELRHRFHALKTDVSIENDIINAFQWIDKNLGGVDVLINNAGIIRNTELVASGNTADLRAVLDVNVLGTALCTREAFQSMKKRQVTAGHIILINSVLGHSIYFETEGSLNMYPPSKFAITAMTEILRQELLLYNTKIKVSSVSPALVRSEMVSVASDSSRNRPELEADDVADAIIYCLQTPPHVQIHELTIKPIGSHD